MIRKFIAKGITDYECTYDNTMNIWAEDIGDEYHTMHELYRHRMALFAALCNVLCYTSWKSKLHSDGTIPFGDERYFVAGIQTPHGQITYHLQIEKWWDKFRVPVLEKAPKYDGHTSDDVIDRLLQV